MEDGFLLIILAGLILVMVRRRLSTDSRRVTEACKRLDCARVLQRSHAEPDSAILTQFEHARSMACPRPVQLNQAARLAHGLSMIIPIGMGLWGIHDLLFPLHAISAAHGAQARMWALLIMGLGVVTWFLFRRIEANEPGRALLRSGEIALGRVTGPLPRSVPTLGITYEFMESQGRVVQATGTDIQGTLDEDSYTLVFYDRQKPENCIAQCSTNCEIATP